MVIYAAEEKSTLMVLSSPRKIAQLDKSHKRYHMLDLQPTRFKYPLMYKFLIIYLGHNFTTNWFIHVATGYTCSIQIPDNKSISNGEVLFSLF